MGKSDVIKINSKDFEITEVIINSQFIPPGNIAEIVLPHSKSNCFMMHGVFNGVWNFIYATGVVKVVAIPRYEMRMNEIHVIMGQFFNEIKTRFF